MSPSNLQDTLAPNSVCFGCGPANPQGLRIKSRVEARLVVADWRAEPHHLAFKGYLNGGIIGTLLDCHSNWAAVHYLMNAKGLENPPGTVTAEYRVMFRKPTRIDQTLHLESKCLRIEDNKAVILTTLSQEGTITATFEGTFVIVREGHPAFDRWK